MGRRSLLVWSLPVLATAAACGARTSILEGAGGTGGETSVTTGTGLGGAVVVSSSSATTTVVASSSSTTTTVASSSSTTSSVASSSSSSSSGTVHPVISESTGSFLQSETSVVATSTGAIAVAWIDVDFMGNSTMGYTFSTDGGATFAPPAFVASPGNREASDPVLAVDAADNVYLAWVAFQIQGQSPSNMRIYVSKAPAGSTTFGAPVQVSAPNDAALYDKPWITVTRTGAVLCTYERDLQPNEYGLVAARSTDGGATWQRSFIVDDPSGDTFRNLAFPCAPRDGGHVWVTYLALTNFGLTALLARSDDDGVTWQPEVTVSQANEAVAFDDPTCVAENDEVWLAYGLSNDMLDSMAGKADKLFSIQLVHSSDAGKSIDARAEAADTAAAAFFQHPYLAREDGGTLHMSYYAGQQDMDESGTFRRARAPAGMGFEPSIVVETPLDFLVSRTDPRWLGDYTGLYWRGGQLYMSYAVNGGGVSHIAFDEEAEP